MRSPPRSDYGDLCGHLNKPSALEKGVLEHYLPGSSFGISRIRKQQNVELQKTAPHSVAGQGNDPFEDAQGKVVKTLLKEVLVLLNLFQQPGCNIKNETTNLFGVWDELR